MRFKRCDLLTTKKTYPQKAKPFQPVYESRPRYDDPRPHRLGFDLRRVMRTRYRIDRFQEIYFVIDDLAQLFEATRPDFTPIYREVAALPDVEPDVVFDCDRRFDAAGIGKKMGRSLSAAQV
jgi:hypothetical protein